MVYSVHSVCVCVYPSKEGCLTGLINDVIFSEFDLPHWAGKLIKLCAVRVRQGGNHLDECDKNR